MTFEGCNSIPINEPVIEINQQAKCWDLHNAGEFISFNYDNINRILMLEWLYYEDSIVPNNEICRIELHDVQRINIKPRDHEMPFSEDTCLDSLIISEENCAVFSFHGGMEIIVECSKLRFRVN